MLLPIKHHKDQRDDLIHKETWVHNYVYEFSKVSLMRNHEMRENYWQKVAQKSFQLRGL